MDAATFFLCAILLAIFFGPPALVIWLLKRAQERAKNRTPLSKIVNYPVYSAKDLDEEYKLILQDLPKFGVKAQSDKLEDLLSSYEENTGRRVSDAKFNKMLNRLEEEGDKIPTPAQKRRQKST